MNTNEVYLYLLVRIDHVDYDQYDSLVVAAHSEDEARKIRKGWGWPSDPLMISITLIGTAVSGTKPGTIIHESFREA